MRRDPKRDGVDFGESETVSWRHPRRPSGPEDLERATVRAHALAQIARSARAGDCLPRAGLPGDDAARAEEPTVVASAANRGKELAELLAAEIAAEAARRRSARPAEPAPAETTPAETTPDARSSALAEALAPLVIAPVKRAPLRLPLPATAPSRDARPRLRRRRRPRARTSGRRRGLAVGALVILVLLWVAVYQRAWSALSTGHPWRAAWETLGLAGRGAGPGPSRPG